MPTDGAADLLAVFWGELNPTYTFNFAKNMYEFTYGYL